MDMTKDAWLADALTLTPPCLFFAPALLDLSKPSSSLSVATRTPFLVAVLDALTAALSRCCTAGSTCDAVLAAVAVEALERLWHTSSWADKPCYAYVSALCATVAAEVKRLGAEFEHSSSGGTLQTILLKLLEHVDSLSSPSAVTRALLLLAMYLPIKRNVETNVAAITRLVFDRMCHSQPVGQEGVRDAAMLLPCLARLGSRSPEAYAVVCSEVKQRLNHERQARSKGRRACDCHAAHAHAGAVRQPRAALVQRRHRCYNHEQVPQAHHSPSGAFMSDLAPLQRARAAARRPGAAGLGAARFASRRPRAPAVPPPAVRL
jgi:hypothetical protein